MNSLYEIRKTDFYYRDDKDGRVKLACNPHLHQHIEFVYMLEGKCTGYADSAGYVIRPGDIFVAFPNQIHRFVTTEREKYMLFIVSPDMIPELSSVLTSGLPESNLLTDITRFPSLVRLLDLLADESRDTGEHRDIILRGCLLAFFGELLRKMPLIKLRSGETQTLKAVVDYCSKNYTNPLSLATLEAELHISRYHISHVFGDKLNISFCDYVNSLRVSQACRYLRQGERSMTEISELVGFSTPRTFNRAFVKYTKQTPSEYKKNATADIYMVSVPT